MTTTTLTPPVDASPRDCPVCALPTSPFMAVPVETLNEAFLDAPFRQAMPIMRLSRCPGCRSLWAADSRRNPAFLLEAYSRVSASYFEDIRVPPRARAFHAMLEGLLLAHARGRRLCDVGCGDGNFLADLNREWTAHGIEPSAAGAQRARDRGLAVETGSLDAAAPPGNYDVIVGIDVIEHVADLDNFMIGAKTHLSDAGILVLVTGDAGSLAARIAGKKWSYLRWAGHVSVMSRKAILRLAARHGLRCVAAKRCNHPASPGVLAWLRVLLLEPLRRLLGRAPSWYPFWQDHQIVILTQMTSASSYP